MRSSRTNPLRVGDLSTLAVDAKSEPARQFWLARLSAVGSRPVLGEAAMSRAASSDPLFPPGLRLKMGRIWTRSDWDERRKLAEADALIDSVDKRGNPALAAELRATALANQKRAAEAVAAFENAQRLGGRSPDLLLSLAALHRAAGNTARFEQILWKVMSDHPGLAEAYLTLFQHYSGAGNANKALSVLQAWMLADPASPQARLLRTNVLMQVRQDAEAEQTLDSLLADQPEDAEVFATARQLYARDNKLAQWVRRLEDLRVKQPKNMVVVESLVDLYAESKRLAEGARVLDAAKAAVKDDPDLLYYLAHLYERIEDPNATEQLLERVLAVDPKHVVASNDLGYSWADQGKHLERAEGLIRIAVESEPDNSSYLDSLGWVLYKRGKFEDAKVPLARAAGEGDTAAPDVGTDPVVLDHLGDTLYRLNQTQDAVKLWRRCVERLGELDGAGIERPDLAKLRLQLRQKLRQADAGQPVKVAPVVETSSEAKQASKE
jgi:tetratricopeptide (TPR) repeat protein